MRPGGRRLGAAGRVVGLADLFGSRCINGVGAGLGKVQQRAARLRAGRWRFFAFGFSGICGSFVFGSSGTCGSFAFSPSAFGRQADQAAVAAACRARELGGLGAAKGPIQGRVGTCGTWQRVGLARGAAP